VAYQQLDPRHWETTQTIKDWWETLANTAGVPKRGLCTLVLLIVWEIWKERNQRQHKNAISSFLFSQIKEEAWTWAMAGAKRLRDLLPLHV
jgi:predicted negative regulator of RcsB-dependent stress response